MGAFPAHIVEGRPHDFVHVLDRDVRVILARSSVLICQMIEHRDGFVHPIEYLLIVWNGIVKFKPSSLPRSP